MQSFQEPQNVITGCSVNSFNSWCQSTGICSQRVIYHINYHERCVNKNPLRSKTSLEQYYSLPLNMQAKTRPAGDGSFEARVL